MSIKKTQPTLAGCSAETALRLKDLTTGEWKNERLAIKKNAHHALYLMSLRLTHSPIQSITNSKFLYFILFVCVCVHTCVVYCMLCWISRGEKPEKTWKPVSRPALRPRPLLMKHRCLSWCLCCGILHYVISSLILVKSLPLLFHILVLDWKPKNPGYSELTVCLAQFLPWSILSALRLNCIHLISRCTLTSCLDFLFEPSLKVNPRVAAFDMFCNIQTHRPFYLFHPAACMVCIWAAKAHKFHL